MVTRPDVLLGPPHPDLRASVIIPARNEAANLPTTLRALVRQVDLNGQPLDPDSFEVILLANNCTDETQAVARFESQRYAHRIRCHVVARDWPAGLAHVGTARRWLMDQACERLEQVGQPRGLIASTDADTAVAPDWIAASLASISAGADAVAGLIRVDSRELRELGSTVRRTYLSDLVFRRLKLELEAILDPNPLDLMPRHDWHGGASFGITPTMYRQIGGLPPLPHLEDVALAEALWRADARFVHNPRVRVQTSARLEGRTVIGFSADLTRWAADGEPMVNDGRAIAQELVTRRHLRRLFETRTASDVATWKPNSAAAASLAQDLGVELPVLLRILQNQLTWGEWVLDLHAARTEPVSAARYPLVPVRTAIAQLRALIRSSGRSASEISSRLERSQRSIR